MVRTALGLLLVGLFAPLCATAQVSDSFTDGDFSDDPAWTGDTDRWTVGLLDGNPALQSNGLASADTIVLATPSRVSRGRWAFTFSHQGVNLSNFNGARVFLMASTSDLAGEVSGYYLQLGANNSDELRLYRQDGDPRTGRTLLAATTEALLDGTSNTLHVTVERSDANVWTLSVDGRPVLEATDATHQTSAFFGLWVKHTAPSGQGYFLDTIEVQGTEAPADTTPPRITKVSFSQRLPGFLLSFSEHLDPATLSLSPFSVTDGSNAPVAIAALSPVEETPQLELLLDDVASLASGDFTVAVSGLADVAGNVMPDTVLVVPVVIDAEPPRLAGVTALEATRVEVRFNEDVQGCFRERYLLSNGLDTPAHLEDCEPDTLQASYVLVPSRPLENGITYTLTARALPDGFGNVLEEETLAFTFFEAGGPVPTPRAVVINEVYYDPPESELEFIELINRSDETFDLSTFRFSDDRSGPLEIITQPHAFPPNTYALLVRNGEAFSGAFPGLSFIEPPRWPSLNNDHDTAVLLFEAQVVDAVPYASSWGGDGVSLERIDPRGPSDSRFNFGASTAPAGATPGAPNSLFAPDTAPPSLHFVEQVSSRQLEVYFDEPLAPASLEGATFEVDGTLPLEVVALLDEGLRVVLSSQEDPIGPHLEVRGVQDLTGNTLSAGTMPIAFLADPGDLLINEILYAPLADAHDGRPDQPEYVEFINRSPRLVSLHRHYWTDLPSEEGVADTLFFGDDLVAVDPEGFAVLFADADPQAHLALDSKLTRAFPEIDFKETGATLVPIRRASLGLRNEGDHIRLYRPDGVVLDEVGYDPSWHHPNVVDATGLSLERLSPHNPSQDAANWTSSVAPSGGTPGHPNSLYQDPGLALPDVGLDVSPSPFSPDRDGHDDVTALRYTLPDGATLLRVRIYDTHGRLVRTLEETALAGRTGQLFWDGLDDEGHALRIGIYVVLLEALDAAGGSAAAFKQPVVLARALQ